MCNELLKKKISVSVLVVFIALGMTHPVLAEMVAYWPMDDGAGTVVTDVVGNNDGTMVGLDPLTAWIDDAKLGEAGAAVRFDGTNEQHILVPPLGGTGVR